MAAVAAVLLLALSHTARASQLFNTNNAVYSSWFIGRGKNNPVYITYNKIADQSGYIEFD